MHEALSLADGTGLTHTVVTTTANKIVQPVHPTRMVVILAPADYETWLHGSPEDALKLVRPYPAERMHVVQEGIGLLQDEG
jgi:putative SOS response-associated peptidase YedK